MLSDKGQKNGSRRARSPTQCGVMYFLGLSARAVAGAAYGKSDRYFPRSIPGNLSGFSFIMGAVTAENIEPNNEWDRCALRPKGTNWMRTCANAPNSTNPRSQQLTKLHMSSSFVGYMQRTYKFIIIIPRCLWAAHCLASIGLHFQ